MIRNALIAGATGLVGSELVSLLVKTEYYNSVHVLTRRPFHLEHLKITSHTIDFDRLNTFNPGAFFHDVYICLGTTIKKAGSKVEFEKVDLHYVVELAKWAVRHKIERLSVISSLGANAESGNFYLRTKGTMEKALIDLKLPHLTILRPSLLLGKRNEFRFGEKFGTMVMKPLSFLMAGSLKKYKPIQAKKVAHVMFHFTIHAQEAIQVIENDTLSHFTYVPG
jgi:uncharacterized protein YbjT (DUF2867 family)